MIEAKKETLAGMAALYSVDPSTLWRGLKKATSP
jgi:hypothetical protein